MSDKIKQYETKIDESKLILRQQDGTFGKFILFLGVIISLFHIWANTFGNISDLWRNSIHMGLFSFYGFLMMPSFKRGNPKFSFTIDIVLACLVLMTSFYLIFFEQALHDRNEVPIFTDLLASGLAIFLSIEVCRRATGFVVPVLAILALSYVLWWGQLVSQDSVFHFRGMSLTRVLYRMYFTDEGLFGTITTISSTFVFMFILFAAFLIKSGGGDFIIRLAQKMSGRVAGGPGLVAVAASSLMGTISGSAIANTVSTGSITIPMMKRAGFKGKFAAGVEVASSTGGQLMPPIMGAGAFIMAQYTGLPYTTIIGVALLPAVLYFSSIAFYVYLEGKKYNIVGDLDQTNLSVFAILREGVHFIIPIFVLIGMLIYGFTPTYAAGFSIVSIILASWLSKEHKMRFKDIIESLSLGSRNMLTTALLMVSVGIIIGSVNMTGISIVFSQLVLDWSGGNLIIALILITLASLLLGMGLPVTAAYVMMAILTVPALQGMGVSILAAHMIIFWLSQDSNVTPPVCLAAFAGAAIAKSSPMETGVTAWKLAKGLYIMPLLFAYTALIDGSLLEQLQVFVFAFLGLFLFAVSTTGYMFHTVPVWLRSIAFANSVLLFYPKLIVQSIGFLIFVVIILLNFKQKTVKPSIS